jgi:hypothetical protein
MEAGFTMDPNTLANDTAIDAGDESQSQATERYYTQKEFDDAMAKTRAAAERRALKPYQELGAPDELRAIKEQFEARKFEEQKSRGDVDAIVREIAAKKDAEIAKRDQIIAQYRVESPLTEAAARYKAVAPDQVRSLLRDRVRVNPEGEVEVVVERGQVRYADNGEPMRVDDLVRTFLDTNPHFVSAGPATTGSRSSIQSQATAPLDITKLNMSNPEHRALYKEYRKANGIR